FVTFHLFVKPVIRALLGYGEASVEERFVEAISEETMPNPGNRPHYLRGIVDKGKVRLSGTQQSHAIFGLSKANCLIRLQAEQSVEAGDSVEALMI
ncbi:MAG: hypothetical protein AAF357_07140, partial [Verrucomicrobiota bacterium]